MSGGGALLLALAEPRTETRFEWLHAPEAWVVILVIIPAAILFVGATYRMERGSLDVWKRVFLATLRACLILAIVAFLCEPTLIKDRVQRESSYILVLIDDSYSMGIADRWRGT